MEFSKVRDAVFEAPAQGRMRVPLRVYAEEKLLQQMRRDRSLGQAQNVASLPGIQKASMVMPDGHEGYGFPIGGVAAFSFDEGGVVSPGGVGYDINCGVRLLKTNLSADEAKQKIRELVPTLFKAIPSGVGSKARLQYSDSELEDAVTQGVKWAIEKGFGVEADAEHCEENGCIPGADYSKVSDRAKKRGRPQIGTLGSGNHFLEIQKIEKVLDEGLAKAFGLQEGNACVMIHSGSRGFGHQVCDDSIHVMLEASRKYGIELLDKELCCAPLDSKEAQDYFGAMRCAVNYAFCNRQFMMHWTRETMARVFGKKEWQELGLELVYDVAHNIAKIEEHDGKKLCVHRKGATRAFWPGMPGIPPDYKDSGQPVIIPGSMQTASYVLAGVEGAKEAFGSTCHGSGRVMSRHEALRRYRGWDVQKEMESRGMAVQAVKPKVLAEEAGGAYKNVDAVVESVEKAGLCKIVARMVPLGVIKG